MKKLITLIAGTLLAGGVFAETTETTYRMVVPMAGMSKGISEEHQGVVTNGTMIVEVYQNDVDSGVTINEIILRQDGENIPFTIGDAAHNRSSYWDHPIWNEENIQDGITSYGAGSSLYVDYDDSRFIIRYDAESIDEIMIWAGNGTYRLPKKIEIYQPVDLTGSPWDWVDNNKEDLELLTTFDFEVEIIDSTLETKAL